MSISFKDRFNHRTQMEFNVKSIQRQIQQLNPEIGLKTDSTLKPSNRIQCEFLSKTDSTIKHSNSIQCEIH